MTRRVHEWEQRAAAHVWEWPDDPAETEDDVASPDECVDNFLSLLTSLHLSGSMSAQNVCLLCHWASVF